MAGETLRTESELLTTILATNISGDISALDIRDAFYSLYRYVDARTGGSAAEYGEIYWSTPASTSLTVNVWAKAAGTTTLALSNNFTMPVSNRLRHDDTDTEIYLVTCDYTITSASPNQTVWVGLSKNGNDPVQALRRYRLIATGGDAGMGAVGGLISLSATDYVELWVMNATGSNAVTIQAGSLRAVKVV